EARRNVWQAVRHLLQDRGAAKRRKISLEPSGDARPRPRRRWAGVARRQGSGTLFQNRASGRNGFHSQAPGARRRRQRPRQHRGHRRRNSQRRPPPRQAGTEVNRQRLITAKNAKSTKGRGDRRSPRIETPTSLRRGNPPWLPSSSSSNSNF